MRAGKYNFTIEQGAQFRRVLTWKDGAGALVNLTGFTARMKIKRRDAVAEIISLVIQASASVNGILLGGAAGTITLTILAVTTTAMNFTEGKYDLELVDGSGIPYRLLEGVVSFRPGGNGLMEANRVIVTGDNTVEVVSVGILGPSGASASFNDTEGDPAAVGTAAAADGTSSNAARRDHNHAINTTELDARYSQVGHAHAESDVTGLTAALAAKEPTIAAGTTSQYWRGDKSWQTLSKTMDSRPLPSNRACYGCDLIYQDHCRPVSG